MKRGRMKYIPTDLLDELADLKLEKGIRSDSDALRAIANYSQVGREAERLFTLKLRRPTRKRGFFS